MKTFHYNMTIKGIDIVSGYTSVLPYSNIDGISLLEYKMPNGFTIRQFIQVILIDDRDNIHVFLALLNGYNEIIPNSLWNWDAINFAINRNN